MASLRYHAGRMVLYEKKPEEWRVKIKSKTGKVDLALSAKELEPAVLEAEYLYADIRAINRGLPKCIDCIHHLVVKAECGLSLPFFVFIFTRQTVGFSSYSTMRPA